MWLAPAALAKTMLAKQIAQQLQLPHVELDALHWEPNWTAAETNVFRERVERALQKRSLGRRRQLQPRPRFDLEPSRHDRLARLSVLARFLPNCPGGHCGGD